MSTYYRPTAGRGHQVDPKSGRVLSNSTIKRLQLELGAYMRQLREAKGLTQREVAQLVNVTDNHISDVENGIRKMSPERYLQFAKVFGVDPQEFGKRVLFHYDPFTYQTIFGGKKVAALLSEIPDRIGGNYDEPEGS